MPIQVLISQHRANTDYNTGLIRTGQQVCSVRFLNGKFKGMTAQGWNMLTGSLSQGTSLYNILNNNQVASEIINTIAGSFGLASTAPFTALMAGVILAGRKK